MYYFTTPIITCCRAIFVFLLLSLTVESSQAAIYINNCNRLVIVPQSSNKGFTFDVKSVSAGEHTKIITKTPTKLEIEGSYEVGLPGHFNEASVTFSLVYKHNKHVFRSGDATATQTGCNYEAGNITLNSTPSGKHNISVGVFYKAKGSYLFEKPGTLIVHAVD